MKVSKNDRTVACAWFFVFSKWCALSLVRHANEVTPGNEVRANLHVLTDVLHSEGAAAHCVCTLVCILLVPCSERQLERGRERGYRE